MKKIILTLISILFLTSSYAGMSEDDKKKTIECAGIYYANSMIPQAELELEKITHSFAAKKFLSSYLVKDGVNEDNLNKELIMLLMNVMENHTRKIPQWNVIVLFIN